MVACQEECKSFQPEAGTKKQAKVQPAIDYIKANLDKSFQSSQLGFDSVHYFSKVFKQITGMSPSSYIDRSKINMMINVIKGSSLLPPEGQYEIQIKDITERDPDS